MKNKPNNYRITHEVAQGSIHSGIYRRNVTDVASLLEASKIFRIISIEPMFIEIGPCLSAEEAEYAIAAEMAQMEQMREEALATAKEKARTLRDAG